MIIIGLGLAIFSGTYIYNGTGGIFVEAANAAKLPDYVVQIADRLLELDDSPRVITQDPIGVYIRQYTGKINTLFGRDLHGYIYPKSTTAENVNNALIYEDIPYVAQTMIDDDYDYLVMRFRETDDQVELIDHIGDYGIYRAVGQPTQRKVRDELGQVLSITNVDENGEPKNGEEGYASTFYEYDEYGNIIRMFITDKDGSGVINQQGYAGFERIFDSNGNRIMERYLTSVGKPLVNKYGYAEVRREYNGRYLMRETYYDDTGNPVNRSDVPYSSVEFRRNGSGVVVSEHYRDTYGNTSDILYDNEIVKSEYDAYNRIVAESYYDMEKKGVNWLQIPYYNQEGKLIVRTYLDSERNPIDRTDGYSTIKWNRNEKTGAYDSYFYTKQGQEIEIDGINLVRDIPGNFVNLPKEYGQWSRWITPSYNTNNSTFFIGCVNLGSKNEYDRFTCQVEIEFKDVQVRDRMKFGFCSQGPTDNSWNVGNVWNSKLVNISEPPEDGVFSFTSTCFVNESMTHITDFYLGFRCDNWKSGMFRIRNVKIEKGNNASEWTPGI